MGMPTNPPGPNKPIEFEVEPGSKMAEYLGVKPPTCGPLYKAGIESFTGMDPEKIPLFAAGFVSGQAEKIYLRACQAAMFRPSVEHHEMVWRIVLEVAERYGLFVQQLETSRGVEMWLCSSPLVAQSIRNLPRPENCPEWHESRGMLCGVPRHQIDYEFHERAGYGQRCD